MHGHRLPWLTPDLTRNDLQRRNLSQVRSSSDLAVQGNKRRSFAFTISSRQQRKRYNSCKPWSDGSIKAARKQQRLAYCLWQLWQMMADGLRFGCHSDWLCCRSSSSDKLVAKQKTRIALPWLSKTRHWVGGGFPAPAQANPTVAVPSITPWHKLSQFLCAACFLHVVSRIGRVQVSLARLSAKMHKRVYLPRHMS